ncbi:MAG TPA: SHOCT domain-containing protein [Anaerolineales bacterium]|nr:SHOCT domain-containing protein [Anaerolineales bacterium]
MMGIGMGLGIFLMILFWAVLILAAVWLVKALFPGSGPTGKYPADRSPGPREIIEQRYARGEISREEFELMRQDLG